MAPHVQAATRAAAPPPPRPAAAPAAVQPKRLGHALQVPQAVQLAKAGPGQPLPAAIQRQAGEFFGVDLSGVRVHVGPQAPAIGALAFTMGPDIFFAPGQYDPSSARGQRILGHELTHVVQQQKGRVPNPFGGGIAVVQDPFLEAEAERMGLQFSSRPVQCLPEAGAARTRSPVRSSRAIQRVATPDLAASLANINYINNTGSPGLIGALQNFHGHLVAELGNYQMATGNVNPPGGHDLDMAAGGLYRFTERMIEQVDGGWNEVGEANRLSTKMNPIDIPILGIPGAQPDIEYAKNGGRTGIEAKAVNTNFVGQVNAQILAADLQLGGYGHLNRRKIVIWIAHQGNQWPGVVGFFGRVNAPTLANDVQNQLNGMAINNADVITVLDVRVNYGGGRRDVQAIKIGPGNWNVNVL